METRKPRDGPRHGASWLANSSAAASAEILLRHRAEGWGAKVIDRLGRDLQARFPGVEGFSPRNLKYMRSLSPQPIQSAIMRRPWTTCSSSRSILLRTRLPSMTPRHLSIEVTASRSH
jgi:hypothetical protein